jgi:hypothetical protein
MTAYPGHEDQSGTHSTDRSSLVGSHTVSAHTESAFDL